MPYSRIHNFLIKISIKLLTFSPGFFFLTPFSSLLCGSPRTSLAPLWRCPLHSPSSGQWWTYGAAVGLLCCCVFDVCWFGVGLGVPWWRLWVCSLQRVEYKEPCVVCVVGCVCVQGKWCGVWRAGINWSLAPCCVFFLFPRPHSWISKAWIGISKPFNFTSVQFHF